WRKYYMTWDQEIKHQRHMAFDEGKAEGLSEGARQKAVENAKNAILQGLNDELISKITGLSVEEVANLRNSLYAESLSV
ncbi:MAG: hypothetical protein II921_04520, partial [Treponema sp.]|nr:hypothetical protein [Treponema sp.]